LVKAGIRLSTDVYAGKGREKREERDSFLRKESFTKSLRLCLSSKKEREGGGKRPISKLGRKWGNWNNNKGNHSITRFASFRRKGRGEEGRYSSCLVWEEKGGLLGFTRFLAEKRERKKGGKWNIRLHTVGRGASFTKMALYRGQGGASLEGPSNRKVRQSLGGKGGKTAP